METFAVDLDRVLDEFELNEDLLVDAGHPQNYGYSSSSTQSSYQKSSSAAGSFPSVENGPDDSAVIGGSDVILASQHDAVENFLDLSEADFAPSMPTTNSLVCNSDLLIDNDGSLLTASEKASALHINDLRHQMKEEQSCLLVLPVPTLHAISGTETVTGIAKKLELSTDLKLANGHVIDDGGLHLNKDAGNDMVSMSATSEAKPSKVEPSANVVSGIKVLHCDETINKDYVVTFGRKWEPTTTHASGLSKSDDDRTADASGTEVQAPARQLLPHEDDKSDCTSERTDSNDAGAGSRDVPENQEKLVNLSEVGDETFVTPDDGITSNGRPGIDFMSFDMDVEVTEEDLQHYLEEKSIEREPSDVRGGEEDLLRPVKEEYFTPMDETSSRSIIVGASRIEQDKLKNGSTVTDVPADFLPRDALLQRESHDDKENGDDLGLLVKLNDDVLEQAVVSQKGTVESRVPSSSGLEDLNDLGEQMDMTRALMSGGVQELRPENSRGLLRDGSLKEVNDVSESDTPKEETDVGRGWDQTTNVEQDSCLGDLYLNADEDDDKDQQRLQRPTSLRLSEKIEVAHPAEEVDRELEETEAHKPFSGLMVTAGSPDAGLGISPVSSDSVETALSPAVLPSALTEDERRVGKVAPVWVPDAEAPNCMQCDAKFTVIKRRHHCRACGKVLCAQCCGLKAKLYYMDNKEARVCQYCLEVMQKVQSLDQEANGLGVGDGTGSLSPMDGWVGATSVLHSRRQPNPNNPSEYCSMIPPLQQCGANVNAPPPTVMVPVGVLKRGGGRSKGEPKQVMFSDGIRPGGDLTELDGPEQRMPYRRQGRLQKKVDRPQEQVQLGSDSAGHQVARPKEYSLNDNLDIEFLMNVIRDETSDPVVFAATRNLRVWVKILNLDCCVHRTCWCFATRGMNAVGQDEVVILVETLPDENQIPYDIFYHLMDIYDDASRGSTVSGMGHTVFTRSFLGSKDHGGFLFLHPTFQCLQKISLPPSPFLFAVLLQKWEIPWAKVFPLRLLLRLGAEFRYYPAPLVGVRFRKPVFGEIGHTIMNLLADFRNYQYSLPTVPGLVIHMEDKGTCINFPRNRYDEVVKALNSSIDHVLALAASFSAEADSHLVCIQNEDGNYQTQAININDKPRRVTGASFVVFNGALKPSSGLTAKSSIVEDGLMMQISGESMVALRQALRDMRDYFVPCGPIGAENPDEIVSIRWVDDDRNVNVGAKSPIDGMAMDGVSSIRIHSGTDYVGSGYLIRWTEVFLVKTDDAINSRRSEPVDVSKISDTLAQACCMALVPHLGHLYDGGLSKIGLRVTLDSDNVGYEIGSEGMKLGPDYMNDLDSELVPAMHCATSPSQEGSVVLELIFHILQQ